MISIKPVLTQMDKIKKVREIIFRKKLLRIWYEYIYAKAKRIAQETPGNGILIELGAGASFIHSFIPEIITSDTIPNDHIDLIVDATKMPYQESSVRFIFMMNVLHHISEVELFFNEVNRCLNRGGKLLIVDQYPGIFSYWVYKFLHHEHFNEKSKHWSFPSSGPGSVENGALAYMVFYRDVDQFQSSFPNLRIEKKTIHTPFTYWLSGGLRSWCLIPGFLARPVFWVDQMFCKWFPQCGSFVDIEIRKI